MRALAVLLFVPGFSLGLVAGLTNLVGVPRTVSVQATDLVWSDRVFSSRADFAAWLAWRGTDYELWSKRHPAAARHFEDPAVSPLATRSTEQPLAAGESVEPAVGSTKALLIASISLALLVAMLALPRLVRSARFLLEPPRVRLPLIPGTSRPLGRTTAAVRDARGPGQFRPLGFAVGRRLRSLPLEAGNLNLPLRKQRDVRTPEPGQPTSARPGGRVAHVAWREGRAQTSRLGAVAAHRVARVPTLNSWVVRRYLPRVTFYAVALFLSFAIGASVAIYLK
jgi:hypothetical protein